jgi:hypothetical protein
MRPPFSCGIWERGPGPQVLGSLKFDIVKCGHESRGTLWQLRWRGPAATANNRTIQSSARMLHKAYNCKCSVGKQNYWSSVWRGLSPRRTDWRYVIPWNREFLQKLRVTRSVKKSPASYTTRMFGWTMVFILELYEFSLIPPILYFSILQSASRSSTWPLPLRFPNKTLYAFPIWCVLHTQSISSSIWLS